MNQPNKQDDEPQQLLWVKLPKKHTDKLKKDAMALGVSRADLMRIILINHIQNGHTLTITK